MESLNIDFSDVVPYTIDFKSVEPYIIDVYAEVYGEEYYPIIKKRITSSLVILYHDVEGLKDYVKYIKRCKSREYAINFLNDIGVDVEKYKRDNYSKPLSDEVEDILDNLIGPPELGFGKNIELWSPLKAFDPNNNSDKNRIITNQIKLINYLLGDKHEEVTVDNFGEFTKTTEYKNVLKIIEEYNKVYEKICKEYSMWENVLEPLESYVHYEEKRERELLEFYKNHLYARVVSELPYAVRVKVHKKHPKDRANIALGKGLISYDLGIDYFSSKNMDKLSSANTSLFEKTLIILSQSLYLKELDVHIPDDISKITSEEDVKRYLEFLNRDDVKAFLPSDELLNRITSFRKERNQKTTKKYITTRVDFKKAEKQFSNNSNNKEYLYRIFKEQRTCVAGEGGYSENNEFFSIMMFTIRENDYGRLLSKYVHESGHVIDQSINGLGFESIEDMQGIGPKNPYDDEFRKYEKFNETITDMFMIEVMQKLEARGIYLIEPYKYTIFDLSNENTAQITKDLLVPLVDKFRSIVIKAKINSNREELIKFIGEENFEELVDAVNKVDYLSRNGVIAKINSNVDDPMVDEYHEQVKRVKIIYDNIDKYYNMVLSQQQSGSYVPKKV